MSRFSFDSISLNGRADVQLIINNFDIIEEKAALNSDLQELSSKVTTNIANITSLQNTVNSQGTALNGKAPTVHSSTATTYGVGTKELYGHIKLIDNITTTEYKDGEALSAYQGYVLNTAIASKAQINHASAESRFGLGTADLYGHCKVIDALTAESYIDGEVLSAYQGKILNDKINTKQKAVTYGTAAPSGGSAGDVYIQYF